MVVSLEKKRFHLLPFRILLWSVLALVLASALIQSNPITLEAELEDSDGIEITNSAEADILVVLDYEAIRQSGSTFGERDFSAAWIDLVEQEVGPTSVATPETLSQDMIDASRMIIVTHSATQEMPDAFLDRLREHALDGNTVLIDRPQGRAREVFSADGDAGSRRGQAITHAAGLGEPFDNQLEQMPLFVDYVGSTSARTDAQTLMSIDGAPVIYAVEFGRGHVVTVDFDLSRQLVALKQGRPAEDFSVPRTGSRTGEMVRTADLIADETLVGAAVPFADLLERFVVYGVIMRFAATPALWAYPDGADGAIIFAHEDSRLGDGGAWKLDYERDQGGTSTLLTTFDSGLTAEGAEAIQDAGGHIGLAWRPIHPSMTRYEPLGIGGFTPFLQPIELPAQRRHLRSILDGGAVGTSRSLQGIWSSEWSAPLEALAEAGIRSDLSYESTTHRGYSFGTGRPFRAMNDRGMPLAIRQYPVTVPLNADEGPDVDELLAASSEGHHQLLTIVTRPSTYADYPDMERFERWLQIFDHAAHYDHRLLNVVGYAQYQRARRSTSVRSRIDRDTDLPEDVQSDETAPDHRGTLLRVTARASRRDIYLLIPEQIGDATFLDALAGTERVGAEIVTSELDTEEISLAGFSLRRVRLRSGFNNLEFYYH